MELGQNFTGDSKQLFSRVRLGHTVWYAFDGKPDLDSIVVPVGTMFAVLVFSL